MAIVPFIGDITSVDWDGAPKQSLKPEAIWCTIEIGATGSAGFDLFEIGMHNKAWVEANLKRRADLLPPFFQQGMVEIETFDTNELRAIVQSVIDAQGPYTSWEAFCGSMTPYLLWEFA